MLFLWLLYPLIALLSFFTNAGSAFLYLKRASFHVKESLSLLWRRRFFALLLSSSLFFVDFPLFYRLAFFILQGCLLGFIIGFSLFRWKCFYVLIGISLASFFILFSCIYHCFFSSSCTPFRFLLPYFFPSCRAFCFTLLILICIYSFAYLF